MSCPAYAELGKKARDVFGMSFNFDIGKVHLIAPVRECCTIDADAQWQCKKKELTCAILGKWGLGNKGTVSMKYASNGLLVAEYTVNGKVSSDAENCGLSVGYTRNNSEDFQSAKLGGKYFNDATHLTSSLTKDFDRSVDMLGSVVVRIKNFLVGYQAGYDTTTSKITKNDLALAMDDGPIGVHFRCVQIPREYGLSLYHRVNDELEVACDAKLARNNDTNLWFMGIGMAYKLNEQWKWRVKIDKNVQLASSMQVAMRENVFLTMSFSLDMLQPTNGQHKVGFGLCVS